MVISDLIFDIGLHTGQDTLYYLKKGFRVVGVEARADLCEIARLTATDYGSDGRLEIVQRAIYPNSDETVTFYINDNKDDWGSLYRGAPEQDGSKAREIMVQTITLDDLFNKYGTPYYVKCDIEGGDSIVVEQLLQSTKRPSYVSVEATSVDDIAKLRACGYNKFQVVNQYLNPYVVEPDPAREGSHTSTKFSHATSGLFGKDLPLEKWVDFGTAIKLLLDWYDLRGRDSSLAVGWLDIHTHRAD